MTGPGGERRGGVAVITGASRGLGAGIAERLASLGFDLGLCARNEPSVPPSSVGPVVTAAVDVTEADALDAFAGDVESRLGPIDIWINNAGVLGPVAATRDAAPGAVRDALLVNIGGVQAGSAAFCRRVRSWPPARRLLVNVSSGASTSVRAGWGIYGATKAAVDHLSRHIAAEEPDVLVASVAPGVIDTDMQAEIRSSDPVAFPDLERFLELERTGAWNSAAWIADHLIALWTGEWATEDVVVRIPAEPLDGSD